MFYKVVRLLFSEIYENEDDYIFNIKKGKLIIGDLQHKKFLKLKEDVNIHINKKTLDFTNLKDKIVFESEDGLIQYITVKFLWYFCDDLYHDLLFTLRKSDISRDTKWFVGKLEEELLEMTINKCLEERDFESLKQLSKFIKINNKNNK